MSAFKKLFGGKKPKAEAGRQQVGPGFLEVPWRKLGDKGEWTDQFEVKLITEIIENDVKEKTVPYIRILLLGQIRAGKSSFLNTIATIDRGRMSQVTVAGGADSSVTFELKDFKPFNRLKGFRIEDTMGVEESDYCGLNLKDVLYLVKGHIAPGYKFNSNTPIDESNPSFRSDPKDKEKVHCVTFIVDANIVGQDNISDEARRKFQRLQDELKATHVPRIVVLTKIDVLCENVQNDIRNTYRSEKILQAVKRAHELYQVPEQNIFPVQNYQGEMEVDSKKNILHLLAIRQMINFGTDFLNAASAVADDDE